MSNHGSKGQRVVDLDDAILGHRLRASDLKTRLWYKRCDARHSFSLEGHPFYKDITLKSVSSKGKRKPC